MNVAYTRANKIHELRACTHAYVEIHNTLYAYILLISSTIAQIIICEQKISSIRIKVQIMIRQQSLIHVHTLNEFFRGRK